MSTSDDSVLADEGKSCSCCAAPLMYGTGELEERSLHLLYPGAFQRQGRIIDDRFPTVPSEEGRQLMHSGIFGADDNVPQRRLSRRVLDRELAADVQQNHIMAQVRLRGRDRIPC